MQYPSKTTQYFVSALLVSLILPVSLMAQVQSAFVQGAIKQAKGDRVEAKTTFDEVKEAVRQARKTFNMAESKDDRAAARDILNAAVAAKVTARTDLDRARLNVQIERAKKQFVKGGLTPEEIAAYQELERTRDALDDLATQMANIDVSTEDGVEQMRDLRDDGVELHDGDVRKAVVKAKTLSQSAAIRGAVAIVGEEAVQSGGCGRSISDFDTAATASLENGASNASGEFQAAIGCIRGAAQAVDASTNSSNGTVSTSTGGSTTTSPTGNCGSSGCAPSPTPSTSNCGSSGCIPSQTFTPTPVTTSVSPSGNEKFPEDVPSPSQGNGNEKFPGDVPNGSSGGSSW